MSAAPDWAAIAAELEAEGRAVISGLISPENCAYLAALHGRDALFRKRIDMARHGYGRGTYGYFAYPLPDPVAALRSALYPRLAPIANGWEAALGRDQAYPADLDAFLDRCHGAGQGRPTPLILKYGPGDYNRLHQDLYGALAFPLQAAFLLSRPEADFTGGELVLTEQSPRRQSRAEVVTLAQGEGAIFAVDARPVRGARGYRRVAMRHGVSRVRSGSRLALGIIFHDAA